MINICCVVAVTSSFITVKGQKFVSFPRAGDDDNPDVFQGQLTWE